MRGRGYGFDEMPPSVVQDEKRLIMRLISGSCLPKATRLVTSRPSALKSYFPQGFRHVEVCGFTDECKVRFAEIAFKSEPKVLAHFKDFIFSNPVINSLMYIPVKRKKESLESVESLVSSYFQAYKLESLP